MKLKINNNEYLFFNNISIDFFLDSVASTFSFKGRFNPENKFHKEIFKPLSFNLVEIFYPNDTLLFTGFILNTSLGSGPVRELQVLSGYSKSGIIEDCNIPVSNYPLERVNVSLNEVIRSILRGFDLNYIILDSAKKEMNLNYKKVVAKPNETIKTFISKLCSQRNIILSHNEKGELVFFKPNINSESKKKFNSNNCLKMDISVNGQSMHSEISVIKQPSESSKITPIDTIKNEMVKLNKPIVKISDSGSIGETKKSADNILAKELKNISVKIELKGIYSDLKCGDIVEVTNPEIYLFNKTRLIISSINLRINEKGEKTIINLLIPESLTGEQPKNIFND